MQERDPSRTVFHTSTRSIARFGAFRFDLADRLLARDQEEIRLPARGLAILRHLVERAGRVLPTQVLRDVP